MMQKNLIIGIIVVVLVAGGFLYIFTRSPSIKQQTAPITQPSTNQPATATPPATQTKPQSKLPTVPVAKPSITSVTMSDAINTSGLAVGSKSVFAPTTKNIYAVLTLKNAVQRTQLSYVRYFNGKYVDSKVSHPSKDGVKNFHFQWTLNVGETRKAGTYRLVFYVNGAKSRETSYVIK